MTELDPDEPFQGRHPDDHPEPEPVAQLAADDTRVQVAVKDKPNQWIEIDAEAMVVTEECR